MLLVRFYFTMFLFDLGTNDAPVCNIFKHLETGQLIKRLQMNVLGECTMALKTTLKALYRIFQSLRVQIAELAVLVSTNVLPVLFMITKKNPMKSTFASNFNRLKIINLSRKDE